MMSSAASRAAAGALAVVALCAGATAGFARSDSSGAAAATPAASITVGDFLRLPVTGDDVEYPVLAMNASGRFVIAYPQTDPFGPLGVVTGGAASGRLRVGRVVRLGTRSDLSPLEPAVGGDGRVALGWSVRRQLHPANRVAFGLDLGELAPGPRARWRTRTVLAPTVRYSPDDDGAASDAAFAGDRVLEDWTTRRGSTARLVLARQTPARGPFHTRVLLRARRFTTIEPDGLGVDGAGHPVLVASLQPAVRATPVRSPRSDRARPSVVAFTAQPDGRLSAPQHLRSGCAAEDLAVADTGQAAAVMICDVTRNDSQVWVGERAPHEPFRHVLRVSGPGVEGVSGSVSIAAGGRVCVTWDRVVGTARSFDANIVRTEVSCAAPGHAFPAPEWQTGRYPTQLNGPELLAGPSGPALARGDRDGRVVLQRLLPAGHLGPVVALSGRYVRNQTVAVDAHGRGIALWDARIKDSNRPVARSFTLP